MIFNHHDETGTRVAGPTSTNARRMPSGSMSASLTSSERGHRGLSMQ
ncbi:hypothetical protein HMPREF1979_01311 [Actinomyces johnsonii F0542]|uniref:Uncharacterized protein n=1 Tax=Actinomyces johnsonii F0542 TaxID=1321818 RepID=U1RXI7_9ACTO|nr:hypothetical protein HMPREF1979_01311 [Actinomyces johnsonii F0542]